MSINFFNTDAPNTFNNTPSLQTTEQIVTSYQQSTGPFIIQPEESLDIGFGDTVSAQLGYAYAPAYDYLYNKFNFGEEERDQDYDPFKDMEGFEEYEDTLKDAVNQEHMSVMKQQLRENKFRRKILESSSIGSQLVAGLFDPINLIALPFGGFTLGAARSALQTGRSVAAIQVGAELIRYPVDPLGTEKEVVMNIGMAFVGGAVLGGLVGGALDLRKGRALRQLERDAEDFQALADDVNVIKKTMDAEDAKLKENKTQTDQTTTKQKPVEEIELPTFSQSAEKTLRETQEFIGPPKSQDEPLLRTTDDITRPFVKAKKSIIQREQQTLPNSIARLEKEIVKLESDPDVLSIKNLGPKKVKEKITKIDEEIKYQTKTLPQTLIIANKNLENKIAKVTSFINKIKGGRDQYAAGLKKIKDELIAQSKGERGLTVGLSKSQEEFLNKILAKEKEGFFTPTQRSTITKSLKEIAEAQSRVKANTLSLETRRKGNEKFIGELGLEKLRKQKKNLELQISKSNLLRANEDQLIENNRTLTEITDELSRRRVEELSDLTGGYSLKDPFKFPDNWYTDNFVYKALVTPLKKAFQSDIPITVKDAFSKLANDAGLTQVAHKYGKILGMSVYTKSSIRNGEYVVVHDKLRKLYAQHTGKDRNYLDIDFQKKGYHEWLEDSYSRILKQETLTDLDKQIKSAVDDFMMTWELRLQEQGMIGSVKSIEKQIVAENTRLLNYIRKLQNVVGGRGDDLQNGNANILLKDAESILRGGREQTQYKNIKDLTLEEIRERFADDYNIVRFVTDQKSVDDYILKNDPEVKDLKDLPLGSHWYRTDGSKGTVFINERGLKQRWEILQRAKKNPKGAEDYLNAERRVKQADGTYTTAITKYTEAGMHLKYEIDNLKYFDNYDDFYDFVVYHEFSHGKFKQNAKDKSIVDYEFRTNDLALERLLQEKQAFNPETRGLALSSKSMKDLESLENLQNEGSLSPKAQDYKNKTIIPEIKRINNELIELHKNLKEAKTAKVAPNEEEFFFPRYWDIDKIKANRQGLENILFEWYTLNPSVAIRQKNGTYTRQEVLTAEEAMKATDPVSIMKRVNDTIDTITKETVALTEDSMAFYGYGKSKHTRHRSLDVPNKLVADFIVTNPVQVMRVYTQRVAPKYEFNKQYGGRSVDQVLADIETDMYSAGKTTKQVNETRKDFLHLYDRVVGRVITNPDRLDQKAVTMLRDLAQLNYLGSAGFSTVPDFAKILMEHDLGNVMKGLTGILKDSRVRMTAKEGRLAGEILEILQGDTHMRLVEDLTNNPLERGYQRKMSIARNLFYNLNGLAPMTNMMKKLDSIIRQHELIEFAIKDAKGTAKRSEIEYLRRYNIDNNTSKNISKLHDDGVIQNTKEDGNGVYLANTEKWLENGISEDTLDTFRGSLNNGIMNTILMGTPADKPIIADGVVYIPQWIGKKFGLKEDGRYKGYTRIETGLAGLPFQFWSYSFAAANKITAAMATGQAKNRAAASLLALGLGYVSLEVKSRWSGPAVEAMWDNMPLEDQLARSFDASGLAAMYSDLFYTAMNTSLALGGPDISMGLLQPKFPQQKNITDAFTAIGGAGSSIGVDLGRGLTDFFIKGEYGAGSKQVLKNLPFARLWFIKEYVNDLGNTLVDIDDDGFEKAMRARF